MEFLTDYGLFLAKCLTVLVGIVIVVGIISSATDKGGRKLHGHLEVTHLNDILKQFGEQLRSAVLPPADFKKYKKQLKRGEKERQASSKKQPESRQKNLYVLDFRGDLKASAVKQLREEITIVLGMATPQDEIVVRLESGGGVVHGYGLAASQLDRIKKQGIPLTVCVDKVAASGGYMMACVANKLVAAPFSMIGSIGVVAQLPNFHRLLEKNDIDFEMLTAGEYKRTLTLFGENTEKGREKFLEELEETHRIFKDFVNQHRPELDMAKIATGEVWLGEKAIGLGLVDELSTSDEYLVNASREAEVYEVRYVPKKKFPEKLGLSVETSIERMAQRFISRLREMRFFS